MDGEWEPELDSELLRDWCDFCEGRKDFDAYHFSTLLKGVFTGSVTPEVNNFLKTLSQYFPPAIYENLVRIDADVPDHDVLSWAKRDMAEKQRLLETFTYVPEYTDEGVPKYLVPTGIEDRTDAIRVMKEGNYQITHDRDRLSDMCTSANHTKLYFTIGAFFNADGLFERDQRLGALLEVFYNIATNYFLAYLLISPLLNSEIDLSNYFEVYLRGGDIILGDNDILVYIYSAEDGDEL